MKSAPNQFDNARVERFIIYSRGPQQTHKLFQHLNQRLGYYPIFIDGSIRASFSLITDDSLLFVDLAHADSERLKHQLTQLNVDTHNLKVVFFNTPPTDQLNLPLAWPSCLGILDADIDDKVLQHALKTIWDGEHWFSRSLTTQLLHYLKDSDAVQQSSIPGNLTPKELKVLSYLSNGASNAQLANELHLSEHTVKSHLYRIYRKINVKNRSEAVAWTHHHLPRKPMTGS